MEIIGSADDSVGVTGEMPAVTANDQRTQRSGQEFRVSPVVDTSAGAAQVNIAIRAVQHWDAAVDKFTEIIGSLYLPQNNEPVTHNLPGSMAQDSRYKYTFNAREELIAVETRSATLQRRVEYDYYTDGRRARKRVSIKDNGQWVLKRTHEFIYDGWNLAVERIHDHTQAPVAISTRRYVWGLDLAGQRTGDLGQQAGGIGGLLAIIVTSPASPNPTIYLPICDHNGNIHAIFDPVEEREVANYEYSPFGVLIGEWGAEKDVCPFRFQSKYYDQETELYYFGYRYYDPASTKWLCRDPLGEVAGANLTAFCRNDPANQADPFGAEAYLVYREFDKEGLRKLWPHMGHFFLAFDERGISNVSRWRTMVRMLYVSNPIVGAGEPDPDAETFSFHPWSVFRNDKTYDKVSILHTDASYIGHNESMDRRAFRNVRDGGNDAGARKARIWRLHVSEDEQIRLYTRAVISRNTNNYGPLSTDIGPYMLGIRNCGTWTLRLVERAGIPYPKGAKQYNRLLPASWAPGGVAIGGEADRTGIPQVGTKMIVVGGVAYRSVVREMTRPARMALGVVKPVASELSAQAKEAARPVTEGVSQMTSAVKAAWRSLQSVAESP